MTAVWLAAWQLQVYGLTPPPGLPWDPDAWDAGTTDGIAARPTQQAYDAALITAGRSNRR